MNIKRNMKLLRKTSIILDGVSCILGIVIVILAIMIFISIDTFYKLFPILFFLAFLMNLVFAFKYYLNNNSKAKYITMLVVSSVLLIITFIAFITTWGN